MCQVKALALAKEYVFQVLKGIQRWMLRFFARGVLVMLQAASVSGQEDFQSCDVKSL
jgi:hypothetical protein